MSLAPIVLFVYNRPWHTEKTLKALANNLLAEKSDLIIYADAPKTATVADKVNEVKKVIDAITGFRSITIIEREENWGLSKSIIAGVQEIVNKFGKIIVLEDDHVTSPYFLKYMNEALDMYENEPEVISIHGYIYPVTKTLPEYFFIKGADCWGWATWKRGWDLFEADGELLLEQLVNQKLTKAFDFNYNYPYTQMLRDQIAGKNNSWAIRWYASAFLKNKLTLYPGSSLIQNIGNDNSGTHSKNTKNFQTAVSLSPLVLKPIPIKEDLQAKLLIQDFFRSNHPSSIKLLYNKISSILTNG